MNTQTVSNRLSANRVSALAAIVAFALATAGPAHAQQSQGAGLFTRNFSSASPVSIGISGISNSNPSTILVIDYVSMMVAGPGASSCVVKLNVTPSNATYYFLLVPTTLVQGNPAGGANQVTRIFVGYYDTITMDFSSCGPPGSVAGVLSGYIVNLPSSLPL